MDKKTRDSSANVREKYCPLSRRLTRLEELVPLMNEIYRVPGLISNSFIPQYKLKSKVRGGSKIKKTYDTPKTAYQLARFEALKRDLNSRKSS